MHAFILLLFVSLPDCIQNQTDVSDTLRLLSKGARGSGEGWGGVEVVVWALGPGPIAFGVGAALFFRATSQGLYFSQSQNPGAPLPRATDPGPMGVMAQGHGPEADGSDCPGPGEEVIIKKKAGGRRGDAMTNKFTKSSSQIDHVGRT